MGAGAHRTGSSSSTAEYNGGSIRRQLTETCSILLDGELNVPRRRQLRNMPYLKEILPEMRAENQLKSTISHRIYTLLSSRRTTHGGIDGEKGGRELDL